MARSPQRTAARCGAAVIEMAIVLPVLVLLLFGGLEIARSVMVKHVLEEAARAGCRTAVVASSTRADVNEAVDAAMQSAGLSNYTVSVTPAPSGALDFLEPVTVSVAIPYAEVSWMNLGFMRGKTLEGVCVMPAEGDDVRGKGKKGKGKKS